MQGLHEGAPCFWDGGKDIQKIPLYACYSPVDSSLLWASRRFETVSLALCRLVDARATPATRAPEIYYCMQL